MKIKKIKSEWQRLEDHDLPSRFSYSERDELNLPFFATQADARFSEFFYHSLTLIEDAEAAERSGEIDTLVDGLDSEY